MTDTSVQESVASGTPSSQPVKKAAKKAAAKKPPPEPKTKTVAIELASVAPHPQNPRIGDVPGIMESLKKPTGQYKPIVVQKSTRYIIDGNHTWKAARELKWKWIDAIILDVTDEEAVRIMLVANRLNDMATYDTETLADLLKGMPDTTGTGYNDDDVRAILAGIEDRDAETISDVVRPKVDITFGGDDEDDEQIIIDKSLDERIAEIQERRKSQEEDLSQTPDFQQAVSLAQLQADMEALIADMETNADQLADDGNYWGIPTLRTDMLMDSIPEPIATWGGPDASEDDGATTWIWNFGLAASKGLPWARTIMSFFTYDTKFEVWWKEPAYQAARVLHNGLTQAIVPDYSFWTDEPRYLHLQATWRAQFLGRFMQEAGMKVMPRVMWCDLESIKTGVLGVPKNAPCVALCIQAISKKEADEQMAPDGLRAFIKEIQPQSLLLYSGGTGREIVEAAKLPKSVHVVHVDNYAGVRRHVAYDRTEGKNKVKKLLSEPEKAAKAEEKRLKEQAAEERRQAREAKKREKALAADAKAAEKNEA